MMHRIVCHILSRVHVAMLIAFVTLWPLFEPVAMAATAPPQPAIRRAPPVWIGMAVMFALLAVVVFINLMPSKRGHQD